MDGISQQECGGCEAEKGVEECHGEGVVLCDVCMIFLKERERRKEGVIVVSCWGIFVCLETLLTYVCGYYGRNRISGYKLW